MDCSMPGFPVRHQLPELAQTHVHLVSDAIHPSHPLSYPSSPAFNLAQHRQVTLYNVFNEKPHFGIQPVPKFGAPAFQTAQETSPIPLSALRTLTRQVGN